MPGILHTLGSLLVEKLWNTGASAVEELVTHPELFSAYLRSYLNSNARTRVSVSEILCIEDKGQFLLIQNARRGTRVAPIGGVIRLYPGGKNLLLEKVKMEFEFNAVPEELDLRGYILAKEFPNFLRWFFSGEGRENNAILREIIEELGEASLIDKDKLRGMSTAKILESIDIPTLHKERKPSLNEIIKANLPLVEFKTIRIVHEGPTEVKNEGLGYQQYRLIVVKELAKTHPESELFHKALIEAAKEEIEESKKSNRPSSFVFASKSEILGTQTEQGRLIGDHAGYFFGKDRTGTEPPLFRKPPAT